MRFLTLTSIAALAFASVSASSVDSSRDVGHTGEKLIPLLKRADQVNGDASPTPVAVGANGIDKAKIGATPQGSESLSKRHKKSDDGPYIDEQQGGDVPRQALGSLSKRHEKSKGDTNGGKEQGTAGDANPQVPGSLSKRHEKSKGDTNSGKEQGAAGDANPQVPGSLSKRHEKSKGDTNGGKEQGAAGDANPDAPPQASGSFSKRAEQANGNVPPGNGQTTGTSGSAAANSKPGNPSEYGV
jgi:hypothetical protein